MTQAFQVGFTRVELYVHADHARAIALYDRICFVREGVVHDTVLIDGVHATPSAWRKSIGLLRFNG